VSLRRQLLAALGLFSVLAALAFSALCLLFLHVVEDEFFDRALRQEAAYQRAHWARHQSAAPGLNPAIRVIKDAGSLPPDLARHRPVRSGEYAGTEGRHYHVLDLSASTNGGPRYLVMEVGRELFVRPRLPYIAGTLALCTLVLLLLTLAGGVWMVNRTTAPLGRLAAIITGAGPEGLPRGFAATFPANEIGALADALDQAIGRIARFIEREQRFTQDASHELRTPLTVIDGAAYLLARQALPSQAAAQVERIRQAAVHMQLAVDTLLALSREDGDAAWEATSFSLLPVVEACILRHAEVDDTVVEVEVEIDRHAVACCPKNAFTLLLDNFLGNAFQHAPGRIRLFVEEGWLIVADQGPGIEAGLRDRIGQAGVKRSGSAGFGLGLSITQRLAARAGIGVRLTPHPEGGMRAALALAPPAAGQAG
jgi:signal transduction histidine kinase